MVNDAVKAGQMERDIHIQWLIDEVNELSDSEWDEVMSSRLYDKDGK